MTNTLSLASPRRLALRAALRISVACALALVVVSGVQAQDGVSPSGKSLIVPNDLSSRGDVYHALPGRDRQIFFKSEAPLENITGQSNQVIGYAVAGSDSNPAALRGGEWRLPVESMKTGIELRDEHLAGKDWLNAKENPHIIFQLDRVESPKLVKQTDAFRTFEGVLVGAMTIKGVSKPMRIPGATITFLNESDATRSIARGNLMAIRASYDITLSDFGVSHGVVGSRVAETVRVDTALYLSTTPPERQPSSQ